MFKKYKKLLIYLSFLLLPLLFLCIKSTLFTPVKMSVVEVTSLPLEIALFPFREIKKILVYHSTYNKYLQAKEEVDLLKSQLIKQAEMIRENKELKEILDFKNNSRYTGIIADVIARDPSNWTTSVIINKGEKQGIRQGMPVLNTAGIVGKVLDVGPFASRVILLNDSNFSAAVLIERTRENGLLSGTLEGTCRLKYLSAEADIKAGDKIITSALSSFFPEGLLVGEVKSVEESQNSPTLECVIKPAVAPSQVERVLVIQGK